MNIHSRPPSFTELLPWTGYIPESQLFVLDDGISLAACLELTPISSEAAEPDFLEDARDLIQVVLVDALPQESANTWVLQIYIQDDFDLSPFLNELSLYPTDSIQNTPYTQHYRSVFEKHLTNLRQRGNQIREESQDDTWQVRVRRIRAVLYQRLTQPGASDNDQEQHVIDVLTRFRSALNVAGISSNQLNLNDFRGWMVPWFNPSPAFLNGDPQTLKELFTVEPTNLPDTYDVGQDILLSQPKSDGSKGVWYFDNIPHSVISVQGMRRVPAIGHLSAEREMGDDFGVLLDLFPRGTIAVFSLEVCSSLHTDKQIAQIKKSAVGDNAEAELTRQYVSQVEHEVVKGNKLVHLQMAFYVKGETLDELKTNQDTVISLLLANCIQPIAEESDLLKLDSYLRNLPAAYDPSLTPLRRRSCMMFAQDVASLLPLYGRSRGQGHPGFVFLNRGGEPLCFDPLHRQDRKKNGHLLVLGPTGSGKSATLTYLLQQAMARHRPRLFIIEAGGSFELLGQCFKEHGLSVNQVTLKPNTEVSLPPFSAANQLDQPGSEDRDHLSEMEIIAKIMITGGNPQELERLTRADQLLIRSAIRLAPLIARETGNHQVLTETVVAALQRIALNTDLDPSRQRRANEMADGMALFCSGVAGHFFNRPGVSWPDADVTILEMGLLAREGYEDQLTVAYLSLMAHIHNLVESKQHEPRQTLVVTDEGHVILTHPLLSNYVVKITKMWRKFGAWFWIATQNLADFPSESKRMLSMIEWWLCLAMPKDEVEQLERFRHLSSAQKRLLLSTRKEPGKYVEGVVLSDEIEALFRNVPPALSLALSQSEKHEKARRQNIMNEHGCSEYEAAIRIAKDMEQS